MMRHQKLKEQREPLLVLVVGVRNRVLLSRKTIQPTPALSTTPTASAIIRKSLFLRMFNIAHKDYLGTQTGVHEAGRRVPGNKAKPASGRRASQEYLAFNCSSMFCKASPISKVVTTLVAICAKSASR